MTAPNALPPAVEQALRRFARRRDRALFATRLGWVLLTAGVVLLIDCLLDRLLAFGPSVRAAIGAVVVQLAAVAVARPLYRVIRRPAIHWPRAASQMEAVSRGLQQRLLTVTTRLAGPESQRGSGEMLDQLGASLARDLRAARLPAPQSRLRSLSPWCGLICFIVAAALAFRWPWLGARQLVQRAVHPWSNTLPVTTTQIQCSPGAIDVKQGTPLRLEASVREPGAAAAWLYLRESGDGSAGNGDWQKFAMTITDRRGESGDSARPPSELKAEYTLSAVDRDLTYFVAAGDAKTPHFDIRVLRRPAVQSFAVELTYPPYTGLPPISLATADGRIEAPVGTQATITVTATEPLQSVLLTVAGEKQLLMPVADDRTRRSHRGTIVVSRDSPLELDLISDRRQAGEGPTGAQVRALPDRPPTVRLEPAGQVMRVGRRDVMRLWLDASDDYGVQSVVIHAQTAGGQTFDYPLPLESERTPTPASGAPGLRRVQRFARLDLAELPIGEGGIVSVTAAVQDAANPVVNSATIPILITPTEVSTERIALLSDLVAAETAVRQVAALLRGSRTKDGQRPTSNPATQPSRQRGSVSTPSLRRAGEQLVIARRAVVRAAGHEPEEPLSAAMPGLATQICDLIDAIQTPSAERSPATEQTVDAAARASALVSRSTAVRRGVQAQTALADAATLDMLDRQPAAAAADRVRDAADRLRSLYTTSCGELGVPTASPDDATRSLRLIRRRGDLAAEQAVPIDVPRWIETWAESGPTDSNAGTAHLVDRLRSLAAIELSRPGGDAIRARDLASISRAVAAIGDGRTTADPPSLRRLADAASVLENDREDSPPDETSGSPDSVLARRESARKSVAALAGESWPWTWTSVTRPATRPATGQVTTAPFGPPPDPATGASEPLEGDRPLLWAATYESAAAARASDFDTVDRLESQLHNAVVQGGVVPLAQEAVESAQSLTEIARHIDRAAGLEAWLVRQVEDRSTSATDAAAVARRAANALQQAATLLRDRRLSVAVAAGRSAAEGSSGANGSGSDRGWPRDRAAYAYLQALGRLSSLRAEVDATMEADAARRLATRELGAARQKLSSVKGDAKASAQADFEQAAAREADAISALARQSDRINGSAAGSLLNDLDPTWPEAAAPRTLLSKALTPSLKALSQAVRPGAADAFESSKAAKAARDAVDDLSRSIRSSQTRLAADAPITATRWTLESVADRLSAEPTDWEHAARELEFATAGLARAARQIQDEAIRQRLLAVRTARPAPPVTTTPPPLLALSGVASNLGAVEEAAESDASPWQALMQRWHQLKSSDIGEAMSLLRERFGGNAEKDPATAAYFEALQKRRAEP